MQEKYLVMVTADNHNKYYRMTPEGGRLKCEYGRVGAHPQVKFYSLDKYYDLLNQKLRKGYVDETFNHVSEVKKVDNGFKTIPGLVGKLVAKMLSWANQAIKANYRVSSDQVTEDAIRRAQTMIDELTYAGEVRRFNDILLDIFHTIPRSMQNVSTFLADDEDDFQKIINREQSLLDTMAGQVKHDDPVEENDEEDGDKTILQHNGISIKECTDKETAEVKAHLDPETRSKFVKAYRVKNGRTERKFNAYCKKLGDRPNVKFLYHGSRNQNYWNIMVQGLKLHPGQNVVRAGAMFGHGLYFAPKAKKSMGYTSLNGSFWTNRTGGSTTNKTLLFVYKVAMGNQYDIYSGWTPAYGNLNKTQMKRLGFDSTFAHAGASIINDECIVYDEDACTIRYILEIEE